MKLPILILVLSFTLSACFPGVGGKEANEVENEFLKGAIVAGFPGMPLYKKAKVIESFTRNGNYGASFVTDSDITDVVNFYRTAFRQTGWDSELVQNSSTNYTYKIKNASYKGETIVNVASDGKSTAITVSVELR